MKKTIQIGFSPCPNDTFIFDALVNQKIDTKGFVFEPVLKDVETLNKMALQKKLPVCKLSYAVMPAVLSYYKILNSGSALGTGVGPLLIKKNEGDFTVVENNIIAIPGEYTTAHFLFSLAYPAAEKKVFLRYDEIEEFVLAGKGLGVIIHENRFTYKDKGLEKIADLGDFWEKKFDLPIPLGCIAIARNLPEEDQKLVDVIIKESIEYAFGNYPVLTEFVKENAREMSVDIMRKHIDLYVNDYSKNLGVKGRHAVIEFLKIKNERADTTAVFV